MATFGSAAIAGVNGENSERVSAIKSALDFRAYSPLKELGTNPRAEYVLAKVSAATALAFCPHCSKIFNS